MRRSHNPGAKCRPFFQAKSLPRCDSMFGPKRNELDTATDNPVIQSFEFVQKIRANQFVVNGRTVAVANERIPATCYAVCDITPSMRKALDDIAMRS